MAIRKKNLLISTASIIFIAACVFVLRSVTSSNDPQQEAATSNRHADPVSQKSVDSVASEPVFDMVPHGGMTVGRF